jgi:hypothetical protein
MTDGLREGHGKYRVGRRALSAPESTKRGAGDALEERELRPQTSPEADAMFLSYPVEVKHV